MKVVETLLADVPVGWRVSDVYIGANWILSLVSHEDGAQGAGVATTLGQIAANSPFQIGHHALNADAREMAHLLLSPDDTTTAAVGLATLNALNQADEAALTRNDAADWLSARCVGRCIAIVGRFPFIEEEIRPYAKQVWVFEQEPQGDELSDSDMATVLPQADVVAITGSSIINHSIDLILPQVKTGSTVVLLGPSTPLSEKLFDCDIDALFGVRVASVQDVIDSVMAGDGFQKMRGLERVSLLKKSNP